MYAGRRNRWPVATSGNVYPAVVASFYGHGDGLARISVEILADRPRGSLTALALATALRSVPMLWCDVELKDGVHLIAHVNVTSATTIGEATVVYPFASLGTPPQSVYYRANRTSSVLALRVARNGDDQYLHRGRRRHNPGPGPLLFDGRVACGA